MEIKERYELPNDIPATSEELRSQFPDWLAMAAAHGKFVLVIDALNQLEDKDNAPGLVWLPDFIPPEVRLIVSTLPGRSLETLERKLWPSMKVELLEPEERQKFIEEYLFKLYSKRLPDNLVLQIASQKQCANPLFLHALLEELRIFGKHEEIQKRINYYLQANDPGNLYELILTRLEEDYEKDHPGLVGQAMSLVFAARQGLSEPELLEIMGVPRLLWTPLFLALQDSLFIRSGMLNFFHEFLKQAISAKYLHNVDYEKKCHLQLADYFEHREIDRRKIVELPWQLNKIREWKRLAKVLSGSVFFNEAWMIDRQQIKRYWTNIGKFSDIKIVDAYKRVIEKPQDYQGYVWNLAMLLSDVGHHKEALPLIQIELEKYRRIGDWDNVASILGNLAKEEAVLGKLEQSLKYLKEAETICQELNQPGLLSAIPDIFLSV